jgi:hypothetical protein
MKKDSWSGDTSCAAPMMGAKTTTRGSADAPHIKMTTGKAFDSVITVIGKKDK